MKTSEMRQLSADELTARVTEWREELFRARCNKVIGQLTNTSEIPVLRKQIARALTLINEMERAEATQHGAG